jgi:hypothetical protein
MFDAACHFSLDRSCPDQPIMQSGTSSAKGDTPAPFPLREAASNMGGMCTARGICASDEQPTAAQPSLFCGHENLWQLEEVWSGVTTPLRATGP